MAEYSGYRLPIDEAKLCASLTGIEIDLEGVISYCNFLIANDGLHQFNAYAWEGMSAAAVVRYARCFSGGVRVRLDDGVLAGAPDELREMHDYVINLRNKHVAHSVNAFEENDVTAQIGSHYQSSAEIQSLGSIHHRTVGLHLGEPPQLKSLAQWVLERVQELNKAERTKLLPIVQTIPLEQIKAYGPSSGAQVDRSLVGKRRPRP